MAIKQKITASSIKNLTIADERLNDTEISGFHARISPKGVIKYYLYYRIHGKQRNFLLGSANALTPAQARNVVHLRGAALRLTGYRVFDIFTALG
ncbi:Arm DNA-binding domain-containing protein, partial [Vibrio vulnificus]|nr:Arm DNA-binding domain-containing protein [Vibrio vulnificus]